MDYTASMPYNPLHERVIRHSDAYLLLYVIRSSKQLRCLVRLVRTAYERTRRDVRKTHFHPFRF